MILSTTDYFHDPPSLDEFMPGRFCLTLGQCRIQGTADEMAAIADVIRDGLPDDDGGSGDEVTDDDYIPSEDELPNPLERGW